MSAPCQQAGDRDIAAEVLISRPLRHGAESQKRMFSFSIWVARIGAKSVPVMMVACTCCSQLTDVFHAPKERPEFVTRMCVPCRCIFNLG